MATRALVIHPIRPTKRRSDRSQRAALEEGVGLAQAIGLDVVHAAIARLQRVTPATLLGKGKVGEIGAVIREEEVVVAIVDDALSPLQQRNLEKAWQCKVIDRTALILEIFGARARTSEGKLQVELASLSYQKSRLVRSWTHLERQRGGFGFLGGPGETQIEVDRRLISERIDKIRKQLAGVVRTRELHRARRADVPYPTVALVGYTNAGKSTLFNTLTNARVAAQDLLFATLDPTIRALKLPSGLTVMLSDTVGFISSLPTELIAAFRATLEEVLEADLLLHVRDITAEDSVAQKADVLGVLTQLFGKDAAMGHLIEVHNKTDLWEEINGHAYSAPGHAIGVSAVTGGGVGALLARIDDALSESLLAAYRFRIPYAQGRAIAWLHAHGQITGQRDKGEATEYDVRLPPLSAEKFMREFSLSPLRTAKPKKKKSG